MWFAKKKEMGGKSDDDKCVKQTRISEKIVQHNASASSKQFTNVSLPGGSVAPNEAKSKEQNSNMLRTSEVVRQKPLIQLPHKPQIPSNTKRLNPQYNYKTISSIKNSDLSKSMEQSVNFFGIVNEIIKPISTTKKNKYMMVCMLIDDSDEDNAVIKFHFFTPEDTTIKQIEVGDIVRLHRAKLELFNNEIDGRVFFSQDIVIFKKDCPDIKPITTAKNTLITDDEKKRVKTLKKWYSEYLRKSILLCDVSQSGRYNIFCKVVLHEPKEEGNVVRVTVTDGSVIKNLVPAIPLQRYNQKKEGKKDHIVTEIIAHNNLREYARLKVDDYVLFTDVEAVPFGGDKFRLEINSESSPEILVGKTLKVADIECRIEQSQQSMNKNNQVKDTNSLDNIEHEDALEVVENNQRILRNLSGQETSVQTRQQKSKQQASPTKNLEKPFPSFCDNKSCLKPTSALFNTKNNCDGKNIESDPGTKSRKQLFTPNYMTDLSDAATDETSEHNLEISTHTVPDEVNPANTNFNDIMEIVKTKYCKPKRSSQQTLPQDEAVVQRSSSRKTRESSRIPLVMLERLSGSEGYSDSRLDASRKRGFNVSESQDDIEDVETVINITCQAGLNMSRQGNKRTRLESLSTEEGNRRTNDGDIDRELESRGHKVSSWLFHPNNKIVASFQDDTANDECDVTVIKQILCCDNDAPDMSKYISALYFRIQAFLMEVIPDPSLSPLDLVSGYCHSGCQRIFLYSTIKWVHEGNTSIPLCPECAPIEQEKELQLMLMMELIIMDPTGHHGAVLAVRNHAEQFLNCSVADFVNDEVIRNSRVQLLTDYTLQNTYRASVTPLLDIGVSTLNSTTPTLILVNSKLKLPRI